MSDNKREEPSEEGGAMMQFIAVFEYFDKTWIASCKELKITLEEGSFDALAIRMKIAIQEIADIELGYKGDSL